MRVGNVSRAWPLVCGFLWLLAAGLVALARNYVMHFTYDDISGAYASVERPRPSAWIQAATLIAAVGCMCVAVVPSLGRARLIAVYLSLVGLILLAVHFALSIYFSG
jgi:hypothetical protein